MMSNAPRMELCVCLSRWYLCLSISLTLPKRGYYYLTWDFFSFLLWQRLRRVRIHPRSNIVRQLARESLISQSTGGKKFTTIDESSITGFIITWIVLLCKSLFRLEVKHTTKPIWRGSRVFSLGLGQFLCLMSRRVSATEEMRHYTPAKRLNPKADKKNHNNKRHHLTNRCTYLHC